MKKLLFVAAIVMFTTVHCTPISSDSISSPEASFDIGFSPNKRSYELLQNAIDGSRSIILIASYSFTSYEIAEALARAAKENKTRIFIIADYKSNINNPIFKLLQGYGIQIRLNNHYKIFHHKFMVIDGIHIQTGSFNYTRSATYHNAENVIILWNVPAITKIYEDEWNRLWSESKDIKL